MSFDDETIVHHLREELWPQGRIETVGVQCLVIGSSMLVTVTARIHEQRISALDQQPRRQRSRHPAVAVEERMNVGCLKQHPSGTVARVGSGHALLYAGVDPHQRRTHQPQGFIGRWWPPLHDAVEPHDEWTIPKPAPIRMTGWEQDLMQRQQNAHVQLASSVEQPEAREEGRVIPGPVPSQLDSLDHGLGMTWLAI